MAHQGRTTAKTTLQPSALCVARSCRSLKPAHCRDRKVLGGLTMAAEGARSRELEEKMQRAKAARNEAKAELNEAEAKLQTAKEELQTTSDIYGRDSEESRAVRGVWLAATKGVVAAQESLAAANKRVATLTNNLEILESTGGAAASGEPEGSYCCRLLVRLPACIEVSRAAIHPASPAAAAPPVLCLFRACVPRSLGHSGRRIHSPASWLLRGVCATCRPFCEHPRDPWHDAIVLDVSMSLTCALPQGWRHQFAQLLLGLLAVHRMVGKVRRVLQRQALRTLVAGGRIAARSLCWRSHSNGGFARVTNSRVIDGAYLNTRTHVCWRNTVGGRQANKEVSQQLEDVKSLLGQLRLGQTELDQKVHSVDQKVHRSWSVGKGTAPRCCPLTTHVS